EISPQEFKKISSGDIKLLSEKMGEKCFPNSSNSIPISDLNNILSKIKYIDTSSEEKAKEKTALMQKIHSIGIYSDGSLENSPFDLISDMQEIDEIIFSERINYKGEKNYDISSEFQNFLEKKSKESISNLGNVPEAKKNNIYACVNDINVANGISNNFTDILSNNIPLGNKPGITKKTKEYKKVNDNNVWPCNDFYCIDVEFKTYEHKVLGSGKNGDFSIESILKRSNNHLKKFVNVSLAQAKMGQNLFELNLRDLNLANSFHAGLVITKKPIPILSVEREKDKKNKGQFAYENLLNEYYKNLGMSYQRKNSLVKYLHIEERQKSFLDSLENPVTLSEEKNNNFENNLKLLKNKNKYFKKSINKKIQNDELNVLYDNLAEIERFLGAINDYTTGLFGAVKGMDRIPVHRNG
ncbi:hypothetical protein CSA08_01490, partial [Candidatus Gracilibacteria bacterium]